MFSPSVDVTLKKPFDETENWNEELAIVYQTLFRHVSWAEWQESGSAMIYGDVLGWNMWFYKPF